MLPRELYLPASGEDAAQWCKVNYIDGGLTREEIHYTSAASDAYFVFERRISRDNGRTWSAPEPIPDITRQLPGGGMVTHLCGCHFDPHVGILYEKRMLRLWPGMEMYTYNWKDHKHPYNDHSFVVENAKVTKLLKYEGGPDYDLNNPFDPTFCTANRAYIGTGMAFAPDGTAYLPLVCYRPGEGYSLIAGGVVLMRRNPATGEWLPSTQQYIDPQKSSRGLLEPDVALLQDGTLLVVCRGSNTAATPGRKWFTLSTDGGKTLSPVQEFRYSDGSQFYSPSSIHQFIRSSKNGKLYWLANIVETPPKGNSPRYPLYIAEIDEDKVAVRKESLVVVDDRGEGESEALQLSNFSVLENREKLDIEIYITRIGGNPEHFWQGPVFRYLLSPSS